MMIGLKRLLVGAAVLALPALASAVARDAGDTVAELQNQGVFCEGTYALCSKAACAGISVLDRLGNLRGRRRPLFLRGSHGLVDGR